MELFSPETPQLVKLFLAMAIVLALMGGLSFILKKIGLSAIDNAKATGGKRLRIIETLPLDARRRMVILRCDEREHVVILGEGEMLLESRDASPLPDPVDTSLKS